MIVQEELGLRTRRPAAERAAADADLLIDILRKRPDLQRRPSAVVQTFMGWDDRRLRAAAEAADGQILSAPGCVGYRLAESVSVDDYNATERARYRSQIREMTGRLCRMDRAVHGARSSLVR